MAQFKFVKTLRVKWNEYLATARGRLLVKAHTDEDRPYLHELARRFNAYPALETAANNVIANWESGDLAGAVRELSAALLDAK